MDASAAEPPGPGAAAQQATRLFERLAGMRRRLVERAQQNTPDGLRLDALLASVEVLARVYAWAAEMQLGAEGFDNTTAARRYSAVQARLLAAARQLEQACEALEQQTSLE